MGAHGVRPRVWSAGHGHLVDGPLDYRAELHAPDSNWAPEVMSPRECLPACIRGSARNRTGLFAIFHAESRLLLGSPDGAIRPPRNLVYHRGAEVWCRPITDGPPPPGFSACLLNCSGLRALAADRQPRGGGTRPRSRPVPPAPLFAWPPGKRRGPPSSPATRSRSLWRRGTPVCPTATSPRG